MDGKLHVVARKTLESHKLGALGERGGVEREGHVNGAVGGLGSEGRLCGDLLAVHDKRLLGDVALVVSALDHQGAAQHVLLAGNEVGVAHGVNDGGLWVRDDVLVSVNAVGGSSPDFRCNDSYGLGVVGDVRVNRKLIPVKPKALEGYDFRTRIKVKGIKGEGHVHGTTGSFGSEGNVGRHRVAFRVRQGLLGDVALCISLLHMEGAAQHVLLAGNEVGVAHGVNDGGLAVRDDVLVSVNAVGSGGPDFRGDDVELLVNVVRVLVLGDKGLRPAAYKVKLLEDGEGLAAQLVGGDLHLNDLIASRGLSREGVSRSDRLTVHGDGLAGGGINNGGDQLILVAEREAGVGHLVGDCNVTDVDRAVAVCRVVGVGCDGHRPLRLVIKRTVINGHTVTGNGECGANELVALVGCAAKLLDGVGVVGQGTETVVGNHHSTFGRETEPDTCGRVELGAVDGTFGIKHPIVPVGVLRMGVPSRCRGEITIFIGDDDVALASSRGGHLEGDASKAVAAVVCLLVELEVAALDLVVHSSVSNGVHDGAVLPDGERVRGTVREQIAVTDADLLQRVGTVRKGVRSSGGIAILDGESGHHVTGLIGHAVDDDWVAADKTDLELGAVQRSAAERRAKVTLKVVLVDLDATPHHIVGGRGAIHGAVGGDGDVDVVGGVEVGAVGRGLADDVVTIGQRVARRGGVAAVVGSDGRHNLAGGKALTVDDDSVVVVVNDGEGDAGEAGVALWRLAGLRVNLLHRYAAANDVLGHLWGVISNGAHNGFFLNLLEAQGVLVQVVALRGLGLINDDRATRKRGGSVVCIVETVTRNEICLRKVCITIAVSTNDPRARRLDASVLERVVAVVVECVVILDSELSTSKRCRTLRQVSFTRIRLITVVLTNKHHCGVVGGYVREGYRGRLPGGDGDRLVCGGVIALGRGGLLDCVGAGGQAQGVGVTARISGERADRGAVRVIDGEHGTLKGVHVVAVGDAAVRALLLDLHVPDRVGAGEEALSDAVWRGPVNGTPGLGAATASGGVGVCLAEELVHDVGHG